MVGAGVGGITESDVQLAAASKAIIIGFNVRADAAARKAIKESGVDMRYYSIIYEVIDEVKQLATRPARPEVREQIVGLAEVRDVFRSPKFGTVAGCMVIDGYVRRNKPIRVLRDNVVIFEGAARIAAPLQGRRQRSARRHRVRHRRASNYNDVKAGDQIECYRAHRSRAQDRLSHGEGELAEEQGRCRDPTVSSTSCCARESRIRASASATVSAVEVSGDLGVATMFFSTIALDDDRPISARASRRLEASCARESARRSVCGACPSCASATTRVRSAARVGRLIDEAGASDRPRD